MRQRCKPAARYRTTGHHKMAVSPVLCAQLVRQVHELRLGPEVDHGLEA